MEQIINSMKCHLQIQKGHDMNECKVFSENKLFTIWKHGISSHECKHSIFIKLVSL